MPLVLEAIFPFRLIDTDKIYKCVLHISSHHIHKHFLFVPTIAIYKTTLTTYTLRPFFTLDAKSRTQKNVLQLRFHVFEQILFLLKN